MKVALLLAIAFVGCGGEQVQKPLEPDGEMPAIAADGIVSIINHTDYVLEVAYLNEVDAQAPRIVRTEVPVGARAVVSGEALPAGLEVEFDLVFIPPAGDGVRVHRKARLVIDGDQVLSVRFADETDPFSVEIELDT
ncbi:MAG TPA: hypothetical protein EYQ18_11010 [Candidatus Handelsmanbacteria bacterium]|nr:hypothetical protein [Candidatus Handelsmanbacteria bacterium]